MTNLDRCLAARSSFREFARRFPQAIQEPIFDLAMTQLDFAIHRMEQEQAPDGFDDQCS